MPYQLLYTPHAIRDIKKLDVVAKQKLKRSLEKLALDPLLHSRKLSSSKIGTYRLRVGNHRVVFDLTGRKIIILRVGHRRDTYRR